jgi:hypothetical protein
MRKLMLLAALAITPLLMSEDASAQCHGGYGYGVYAAPVVVTPHHPQLGYHGSPFYAPYRGNGHCRSPYRYGSRYGRQGGYGHNRNHGRGYGRGGVSLHFGF